MLKKQAGLTISHMDVARIGTEIGNELYARQEQRARQHGRRELKAPLGQPPIEIACVLMDGGRIRTRAPDQGAGVHEQAWKEDKVGVLWKMTGQTFDTDPHPEPPRCFCEKPHVLHLVRGLKQQDATSEIDEDSQAQPLSLPAESPVEDQQKKSKRLWPPERVFRTCVASMKDVHQFGPVLAAEAQRRGFYDAPRQVFLGDGDSKNWTVQTVHFPHFTAVTDFVHPVAYVFEAAGAVTNSPAAEWEQYLEWMTDCWQGRVRKVIQDLHGWQGRLGEPPADAQANDPREVVRRTITYLTNNSQRMDYLAYRLQGLPITSCLVESAIKQINWRVKGTEKFWNRPAGAEAILQLRAAVLSDGDVLSTFVLSRPGCIYHRRSTANHPKSPD
jgi:hypothetical protein